ncbi:MAG: hypothetical protein M1825_005972 [Sarcosagium campestre]|nr:MAG: hypothetical protein M1825_005972 [Sarcosagium campestre]
MLTTATTTSVAIFPQSPDSLPTTTTSTSTTTYKSLSAQLFLHINGSLERRPSSPRPKTNAPPLSPHTPTYPTSATTITPSVPTTLDDPPRVAAVARETATRARSGVGADA